MINRRAFLKLTAAASAALLGLKPKAKPERVVGTAGKIEVEYEAGKWVDIGGYLIPWEMVPQVQELLKIRLDDVCFLPLYDAP